MTASPGTAETETQGAPPVAPAEARKPRPPKPKPIMPEAVVMIGADALATLVRAAMVNVDGAAEASKVLDGLEQRLDIVGPDGMALDDAKARERQLRQVARILGEGRKLKPTHAMPAQLGAGINALARACLAYGRTASAARGPVIQLQTALLRLGNATAREQALALTRMLQADARQRRLKQDGPTAEGIGPTPETRERLRGDALERLSDDGKITAAQFGAGMEIRDVATRIAGEEGGTGGSVMTVKVDGGGVGSAPVERLADLLSSPIGKRYQAWQLRMAVRPAGESRRAGGSLLDLAMAVLVDNLNLTEAAQRVQVRRDKVVEAVILVLDDYIRAPDDAAPPLNLPPDAIERRHNLAVAEEYFVTKQRLERRALLEREGRTTQAQKRAGTVQFRTYSARPLDAIAPDERYAIYRELLIASRGETGALKLEIAERHRIDPAACTAIWYALHPIYERNAAADAWWAAETGQSKEGEDGGN